MVVRVIIFLIPAGDNPARAAIPYPRCYYGILVVVTSGFGEQHPLPIAEHGPVFCERKWPVSLDKLKRVARLGRQIRGVDPIGLNAFSSMRRIGCCSRSTGNTLGK